MSATRHKMGRLEAQLAFLQGESCPRSAANAASLAERPAHFEGVLLYGGSGRVNGSYGWGHLDAGMCRLLTCGLEDPRVAQAVS